MKQLPTPKQNNETCHFCGKPALNFSGGCVVMCDDCLEQPKQECDCCGWDDAGFQHEPQCSSLSKTPNQESELSKDVEERFDEQYVNFFYMNDYGEDALLVDGLNKLKQFLARELSHQREEVIEEMGFWDLVKVAEKILEKYPSDVFTGNSGDSGVVFVSELRKLLNSLKVKESRSLRWKIEYAKKSLKEMRKETLQQVISICDEMSDDVITPGNFRYIDKDKFKDRISKLGGSMSANNKLIIEKLTDGYYISDVDIDGSGGSFIHQKPYKTLEEAVVRANEYMEDYPVEYGLSIKLEEK